VCTRGVSVVQTAKENGDNMINDKKARLPTVTTEVGKIIVFIDKI